MESLATWIVGAVNEAVVFGGLTALGAGLYSFDIAKESSPRKVTQRPER